MDLGDLSGLIGRPTITCLLPSSSCRSPGPENALGGSEGAEAPRAWSAGRWGDADHGSEAAEGRGSRWVRWGGVVSEMSKSHCRLLGLCCGSL